MSNFQTFQLDGYLATEKQQAAIARLIVEDYLEASRKILRDMQKVYAKYLTGISPDDYYNEMIKYNRLQTMLKDIQTEYLKAAKKAGGKIAKSSELGITNNYYR